MSFGDLHFDYSRTVMQRVHDVEVNASISSFFDCGWRVRLGDEQNGYIAEAVVGSLEEAERWLYDTAKANLNTERGTRISRYGVIAAISRCLKVRQIAAACILASLIN